MGSLIDEAHVLNVFLEGVVGSHRVPSWTHGSARELADRGAWDHLVGLSSLEVATITNSNIHTSCAYEVLASGKPTGVVVYLSTVIPAMTVFNSHARRAAVRATLDMGVRQALELFEAAGFRYMEDRLCRTMSPYVDPDFGYPLVYFEMLFEWFQGEEMFSQDERLPPWVS